MANKKKRGLASAPSNVTREELVAKDRRLSLKDSAGWAAAFGTSNHAGKTVTLNTAMQLATVWACVRLTAQAVSCLPLSIFEKRGDNSRVKVEADDALVDVLCESPNEDQTPLEFWETMVAWLMTTGNAYAEKVEIGTRLSALQPMPSTHCHPFRDAEGALKFNVVDRGKSEILPREKVFHLKGFGFGGDVGLSPIQFGSQTFGSAIAIDEAAGRLFGKGLQASGILSSEKILDPKQRAELENIMSRFVGSSNAGKLMILEAGLKYDRLSLSPVDAQMLENHRFSVEEMCRWFGMPPIIIGHAAQGQTMWGSGVEQILLAWLTLGIDPLCDRIEARIKKQLIRQASGAAETVENTISVLDVIGNDAWGEGVTAKRVAGALRAIGDRDVVVNINSPGGNYFEGLAIYNTLREHKAKVTVKILGVAASAASVIAMAADEVQIARAGFLMIHNAWVVAEGDRHQLREVADFLEPFDAAAVDIYVARSGMDAKDVAKMLDRETWIGGAEAVEKGLADALLPSDAVVASAQNSAAAKTRVAAHRVDDLLAQLNVPRSERRDLIAALKGGMPGAASTGMHDAAVLSEVNDLLKSTLNTFKTSV